MKHSYNFPHLLEQSVDPAVILLHGAQAEQVSKHACVKGGRWHESYLLGLTTPNARMVEERETEGGWEAGSEAMRWSHEWYIICEALTSNHSRHACDGLQEDDAPQPLGLGLGDGVAARRGADAGDTESAKWKRGTQSGSGGHRVRQKQRV